MEHLISLKLQKIKLLSNGHIFAKFYSGALQNSFSILPKGLAIQPEVVYLST